MKPALFLAILGTVFHSALADDITFTNRTATFTDLQGRSYRKVQLVRGDQDGLIWRNGVSGGRICYTNLDADLMESFGISSNRIEGARARAEKKAIADARYRSLVFTKAGTKPQGQAGQTNAVVSLSEPNGSGVTDYARVPYDPGYPYPPAFIYGFGEPTVAASAPSAMSSPTAATALSAPSAPNGGLSLNAGSAPNVVPVPAAPPALSAPAAAPAAPVRRR